MPAKKQKVEEIKSVDQLEFSSTCECCKKLKPIITTILKEKQKEVEKEEKEKQKEEKKLESEKKKHIKKWGNAIPKKISAAKTKFQYNWDGVEGEAIVEDNISNVS